MRNILVTLAVTTAFASPALAQVDSCMAGVWQADIGDIADMLALDMNANARPVGGRVLMQMDPSGSFRITAEAMVINVTVDGAPSMDVTVTGYSAGHMTAEGNAWNAAVGDYNLVGSADVLGQPLTIPFTSASGMFGGGLGWFECAGNSLRFETADGTGPTRIPRNWQRVG